MAAWAVRDHAERMMRAAKGANPRPVRRLLRGPGLLDGWGRTVAALLRNTEVFGLPERRAMMSFLALRESACRRGGPAAARAGAATPEELMTRMREIAGVSEFDAPMIVGRHCGRAAARAGCGTLARGVAGLVCRGGRRAGAVPAQGDGRRRAGGAAGAVGAGEPLDGQRGSEEERKRGGETISI